MWQSHHLATVTQEAVTTEHCRNVEMGSDYNTGTTIHNNISINNCNHVPKWVGSTNDQ